MRFFESDVFFDLGGKMGPRAELLKQFLARLVLLPACLFIKVVRTGFRAVGFVWGGAWMALSLGCSADARAFFVERAYVLSRDLVDWLLLPFSVLSCFFRLLLG